MLSKTGKQTRRVHQPGQDIVFHILRNSKIPANGRRHDEVQDNHVSSISNSLVIISSIFPKIKKDVKIVFINDEIIIFLS